MLGGKAASATLRIRDIDGLENATCLALHPASDAPVTVEAAFKDGELRMKVPLERGCAMVRITRVER
jgi:hypothetical protein